MRWTRGRAVPGNSWDLLDGEQPAEPPTISVIVSHYRQPAQLARTLHALQRQDHPANRLELIVADDGSPKMPVVPDGVRLVRQDDAGFRLAAIRNLGVAASTGDVLVFLDADTTPEPSFVRELTRLPAIAPDCIAVGHRRHADLTGAAATDEIERLAPTRELAEPEWLAQAYRESRNLLDADDRSYRFVIGAVLACSRRMYEDAGPFDETFTTYGGEDWEWAYRAWVRGAMLAHIPTAVAWHDGPDVSGRSSDLSAKNDEAIRLSDLIPVPGSRGHGTPAAKVDIVVTGPTADATSGQAFVSVDSVLAAIPGAEFADAQPDAHSVDERFDRVRLRVEIVHPLLASRADVNTAIQRVASEQLAELTVVSESGVALLCIVSTRAEARNRRWGRDDLFPTSSMIAQTSHSLRDEADVEAYLGGWGV
jgi:GT2 family glycosyltransferase